MPHGSLYSHVVDHMVMWEMTWQDDVAAAGENRTLTWQVTVQVVGMAQWLIAMWPSHALPRGTFILVV